MTLSNINVQALSIVHFKELGKMKQGFAKKNDIKVTVAMTMSNV